MSEELSPEEHLLRAIFGEELSKPETEEDRTKATLTSKRFEEIKAKLHDVLITLAERERKVLELRFGLGDGYQRTFEEVGKQFHVTRERIRQIEAKALRKMRHPTRIRQLVGFMDQPLSPSGSDAS